MEDELGALFDKTIAGKKWDFVVLQENSSLAFSSDADEEMFPYARVLDEKVKSTGGQTAFLMTWAPKDGIKDGLKKTSREELQEAKELLIQQKPLVQAYVIDQVRDKMIGGEAAVGVIYSGEMLYIQEEVENLGLDYRLEYVVPKEGTNLWLDSWVIPANAANKENAEKWINFLCRPEIALMNFEYITYSTPNQGAICPFGSGNPGE